MSMSVALGADHAGYELKVSLLLWLREQGYEVIDVGAYSLDPLDDYPDFSQAVAQSVASGRAQRGIIVCGSGVGGSIAANKVPGVRASICHDTYTAGQGVEHDDMNVLCLGARVIGEVLARELVTSFLSAQFIDEGKYRRRLEKVIAMERSALNANLTPTGGG